MADMLEDDSSSHDGFERNFGQQEWDKLEENFVNAGYREGITAGKEEALQEGFDEGFATVGAPVGREVGSLRGLAGAILALLSASSSTTAAYKIRDGIPLLTAGETTDGDNEERVKEMTRGTRAIVRELGAIQLSDLVPPDLEAIEHAKVHHSEAANDTSVLGGAGSDNAPVVGAVEKVDKEAKEKEERWKAKKGELGSIRQRLMAIVAELGLEIVI